MTDREIEKFFVTPCDRILIALLQKGEASNSVLAKAVGLHPVHLCRLLSWLRNGGLVWRKRVYGRGLGGGIKRVNRLTSKGREMAELGLQRLEILKRELSQKELKKMQFWAEGPADSSS
ncbi:MAG: hypothetical protein OEY22_07185 [Candidatus Bathyarchaeota archaeon]|nr:hypothetical protein [Candidatus Bathyarchaeota archaeon]MDH5786768.1 hypothetical protein [Candidatus Bathyarchaeota archaeon]